MIGERDRAVRRQRDGQVAGGILGGVAQDVVKHAPQRRTGARADRAAFGITAVCIVALFLARSVIGVLFGASAEANAGVTARLPLFLATLPLLAYTRVTIAYFYATEKAALSYVLVFSEPVLTFAVLLILPQLFKLTGVWLAIPAAQALKFCIAVPARRRTQRARELPA